MTTAPSPEGRRTCPECGGSGNDPTGDRMRCDTCLGSGDLPARLASRAAAPSETPGEPDCTTTAAPDRYLAPAPQAVTTEDREWVATTARAACIGGSMGWHVEDVPCEHCEPIETAIWRGIARGRSTPPADPAEWLLNEDTVRAAANATGWLRDNLSMDNARAFLTAALATRKDRP